MPSFIEQRLRELIPDAPDPLSKAARYSLLASGKRLRPRLVLLSAEAFGVKEKKAIDPACAIELVHTYSLIHDDLPCMDDDDLRRGKPSLHKVFGEAMALLTGDYLLTFAFEVLTGLADVNPEQKIDLIYTLSKAAGAEGMIGGQAIDIGAENTQLNEETLKNMHIGKTGALFGAALEFGAILGSASVEQRKEFRQIGHDLGFAYQILDDIQDQFAESDSKKNKPTAVSIYGMNEAKARLQKLKDSLSKRLAPFSLGKFVESMLNL